MSKEKKTPVRSLVEVDLASLQHAWAVERYDKNLNVHETPRTRVCQRTVHFWWSTA